MNETWATNHGDRVIVFQRLTVLGTKWRYQVIAANGELVEHGESYSRRIDAVAAAERHHPRAEIGEPAVSADRKLWRCDQCDWYATEFLATGDQAKRSTEAHVSELCRHYAAAHPSPGRCPSCEHRAEFHQPDGCWYSVTHAKPETTVGCNCIGWTVAGGAA